MPATGYDGAAAELDKLILNCEYENQQYVKLIEHEDYLTESIKKEGELKYEEIQRLEQAISQLDKDTKQCHKQFLLNKENMESQKKTNHVLTEHVAAMTTKLDMLKLKRQQENTDHERHLQHYRDVCTKYKHIYESTPLFKQLKESQTKVDKIEEEHKEKRETLAKLKLKIQAADKNNEFRRMDTNTFIIKLAEMKVNTLKIQHETELKRRELAQAHTQTKVTSMLRQCSDTRDSTNTDLQHDVQKMTEMQIVDQSDDQMDCDTQTTSVQPDIASPMISEKDDEEETMQTDVSVHTQSGSEDPAYAQTESSQPPQSWLASYQQQQHQQHQQQQQMEVTVPVQSSPVPHYTVHTDHVQSPQPPYVQYRKTGTPDGQKQEVVGIHLESDLETQQKIDQTMQKTPNSSNQAHATNQSPVISVTPVLQSQSRLSMAQPKTPVTPTLTQQSNLQQNSKPVQHMPQISRSLPRLSAPQFNTNRTIPSAITQNRNQNAQMRPPILNTGMPRTSAASFTSRVPVLQPSLISRPPNAGVSTPSKIPSLSHTPVASTPASQAFVSQKNQLNQSQQPPNYQQKLVAQTAARKQQQPCAPPSPQIQKPQIQQQSQQQQQQQNYNQQQKEQHNFNQQQQQQQQNPNQQQQHQQNPNQQQQHQQNYNQQQQHQQQEQHNQQQNLNQQQQEQQNLNQQQQEQQNLNQQQQYNHQNPLKLPSQFDPKLSPYASPQQHGQRQQNQSPSLKLPAKQQQYIQQQQRLSQQIRSSAMNWGSSPSVSSHAGQQTSSPALGGRLYPMPSPRPPSRPVMTQGSSIRPHLYQQTKGTNSTGAGSPMQQKRSVESVQVLNTSSPTKEGNSVSLGQGQRNIQPGSTQKRASPPHPKPERTVQSLQTEPSIIYYKKMKDISYDSPSLVASPVVTGEVKSPRNPTTPEQAILTDEIITNEAETQSQFNMEKHQAKLAELKKSPGHNLYASSRPMFKEKAGAMFGGAGDSTNTTVNESGCKDQFNINAGSMLSFEGGDRNTPKVNTDENNNSNNSSRAGFSMFGSNNNKSNKAADDSIFSFSFGGDSGDTSSNKTGSEFSMFGKGTDSSRSEETSGFGFSFGDGGDSAGKTGGAGNVLSLFGDAADQTEDTNSTGGFSFNFGGGKADVMSPQQFSFF